MPKVTWIHESIIFKSNPKQYNSVSFNIISMKNVSKKCPTFFSVYNKMHAFMVYLKCCIIPDLTTNCKPVTEVSFIVEVKGWRLI